MALDPKIKAIIEILLKDQGTRQAVIGMAQAKAGADKFSESLKRTETQSDKLGAKLIRYFSAAVLGRIVFGAVTDFARFERQLDTLSRQFGAEHIPAVRAFLEALEASSGIVRQGLLPNLNLLAGITGNVTSGMELMKIAAAAANQGFGDITQNAFALHGILKGEASNAQRIFGVAVKDTTGALRDAGEVLEDVRKKFLESGKVQEGAQSSLDKATTKWNDFKLQLGEVAAGPLSSAVALFQFLLNTVRSIGPALNVIVGKIQGLSRGIGETFDVLTDPAQFGRGFGERISNAFASGFEGGQQRARDAIDKLKGLWTDPELPKNAAKSAEEIQQAIQDAIDQASAAWRTRKEEEELKAAQELAKKRTDLERKIQDDLLAQQLAMAKEGSEERLDLEMQALERARQMAIQEAEKVGADVAAINRRFDLAREAALKVHLAVTAEQRKEAGEKLGEEIAAMVKVEEEAFAQLLDAQIEMAEEASAERLRLELQRLEAQREQALEQEQLTEEAKAAIRETFRLKALKSQEDFAAAEIQLARQAALTQSSIAQQVAAASIGAALAIFGESKSVRIAAALIDTWGAANAAMASVPWPYNIAVAAAVVAAGLANVAKMQSIQPGSTGGGGRGGLGGGGRASRLAARGGRQEFSGLGEKAGVFGDRQGSTTIDRRSTVDSSTTIDLRGATILDDRALERRLRKVRRRERAKFIR